MPAAGCPQVQQPHRRPSGRCPRPRQQAGLLAAVLQTEIFQDGTLRLEQPRVEILPPEIDVEVLTGAQARARAVVESERGEAIAEELRQAADLLDRLTAESVSR